MRKHVLLTGNSNLKKKMTPKQSGFCSFVGKTNRKQNERSWTLEQKALLSHVTVPEGFARLKTKRFSPHFLAQTLNKSAAGTKGTCVKVK